MSHTTHSPYGATTDLSGQHAAVVTGGDSTSFLFPNYTTLDSLRIHAVAPYRKVDASTLFGYTSEQASIPLPPSHELLPTASCGYGVVVLVLLAFYATLLYRHLGDVGQLLARMTLSGSSGERLQEDSGSSFSRFLTICGWLGIGVVAASVIRVAAPFLSIADAGFLFDWGAALWTLLLVGALLLVLLYQLVVTTAIGALTFSQYLLEQLWLVKRMFFALTTILCTPLLLLYLLAPASQGTIWLWMIIIELILLSILYLRETRTLFISKKISILHWFLYLCTVEIFPLSLLGLLAGR